MWVGVGLWPAQGVETGRTAMPMPAGTALQSLPVASHQSSAPGCLVLSGALEQLGPLAWKSQGKGLSRQRSNPSGRVRAGAEPRVATGVGAPSLLDPFQHSREADCILQAQSSQRLPRALGKQFTLAGPGVTHLPAQQDNHFGSGVRNQLNILKPSQINEIKMFKESLHEKKKKNCKGPHDLASLPRPSALLPHPSHLHWPASLSVIRWHLISQPWVRLTPRRPDVPTPPEETLLLSLFGARSLILALFICLFICLFTYFCPCRRCCCFYIMLMVYFCFCFCLVTVCFGKLRLCQA